MPGHADFFAGFRIFFQKSSREDAIGNHRSTAACDFDRKRSETIRRTGEFGTPILVPHDDTFIECRFRRGCKVVLLTFVVNNCCIHRLPGWPIGKSEAPVLSRQHRGESRTSANSLREQIVSAFLRRHSPANPSYRQLGQ